MQDFVNKNLIYKTIVGSTAYGLNTPESDIDIKGITIAPKEYYFGLKNFEQQEIGKDCTIYAINKFVRLARDNNPNIIEMLYTDSKHILFMNKYLEFKEISFKGKTKKFNIISKTSFENCKSCKGTGIGFEGGYFGGEVQEPEPCDICYGTGKTKIVLGRISWYSRWRQYTFSPDYPTTWNKDCLQIIQDFLQSLMKERNK